MKQLSALAVLTLVVHGSVNVAWGQSLPMHCNALANSSRRLACYDQWAAESAKASSPVATPAAMLGTTPLPPANPEAPSETQTAAQRAALQPSEVTRFWDLAHASARETLEIRGYRPISLALSLGDGVSTLPNSPTNGAPATATAFRNNELKISLSVRTKIASGLLREGEHALRDSLWFGYSQQSYWQLFNGNLSRPFRATDHEPELIYVFPHAIGLPSGWTLRMSGVGVVHQSNGQGLPLSRSWNRVYTMAAADKIAANGDRFTVQGRFWQRLREDLSKDDNPDISDFVGRAELSGRWSFDAGPPNDKTAHTLGVVLRHSTRTQARGSVRLEYLRSLGNANSGLRLHTQVFSGFGDSVIEYNRKRTVASLGLSLVDW